LPDQAQLGLQQSQNRVANPGVPVVGGQVPELLEVDEALEDALLVLDEALLDVLLVLDEELALVVHVPPTHALHTCPQ
jgi:hypothetical protein